MVAHHPWNCIVDTKRQMRPVRLANTETIFWMFLVHGRSEDRMNPTLVSGMTRRLWPYDEIHLGREQMWLVGRLEHAETGWDATPHLWKLFHVLSGYILVQATRVLGKDPETMTSLEPGCIFLNRYCSTIHQLKVTFFFFGGFSGFSCQHTGIIRHPFNPPKIAYSLWCCSIWTLPTPPNSLAGNRYPAAGISQEITVPETLAEYLYNK